MSWRAETVTVFGVLQLEVVKLSAEGDTVTSLSLPAASEGRTVTVPVGFVSSTTV